MVAFRFSHVAVVITSLERNIKMDRKSRSFVLEKCTSFQSIIISYIIKAVPTSLSEINCLCLDSFREVITVLIAGEGL